ncbi:MAG: hypothetical protein AAGJ10_00710 [Bacteroidota bacterium]
MKKLALIALLTSMAVPVLAQGGIEHLQDPVRKEFQFIGYSFTKTTVSNISPTNDFLQGQVIGRMFGGNSTNTSDNLAYYTEQRFVPFMVYRPAVLDGLATFRALFKIDYTFGDRAYGAGNNAGGGIGGGQVNMQTLLANISLKPTEQPWNVVVGLQRIFDNPRDPNINTVQFAQNSGSKLSYWGTQGTGITWYGLLNDGTYARAGAYQLWENLIAFDDDVSLFMVDLETRITAKSTLGVNAWYVADRGKEAGGVSVLGQGLTSQLADYNGATRIRLPGTSQKYEADLFWAGLNYSHGRDFVNSRLWLDAFVNTNFGVVDTLAADNERVSFADVLGVAANARASYKWGGTDQDFVSLEGLYTTGDENGASDRTINSVLTGNVWGTPAGIFTSHRALLMFPDPQVINRFYSMVHDISNLGLGVSAGFLTASKSLIPNRLHGKVGLVTAFSNVAPRQGGRYIGTEINAEVKYNLGVFLTVGYSAAYAWLGDFYDAPTITNQGSRPMNPLTHFVTLSWLMF